MSKIKLKSFNCGRILGDKQQRSHYDLHNCSREVHYLSCTENSKNQFPSGPKRHDD